MENLERNAGRVLLLGIAGPALTSLERDRLRRLRPAGLTLFRRNFDSPDALRVLGDQVEEAVGDPVVLAIDQEGGRVNRLEGWVGPLPAAATLADRGPGATFGIGQAIARVLRALGISVNFAPVVDLCSRESGNGVGDRSFGIDPLRTADLAGAFLDGLQGEGIAGCVKHFPGLGATTVDSHRELPVCDRSLADLEAQDLLPFRALADRAAAVMVSHAAYPAVVGSPAIPASLSFELVTNVLRGALRYRGVVISDDLEMGAVAPLDRDGEAAVRAISAGCDVLLYCSDLARATVARDALVQRAVRDTDFARRLADAASRADALPRSARGDGQRFDRRREELWASVRAIEAEPFA